MSTGPSDERRHEALLQSVAQRVAALDGRPPGGALLGPRLLLLAALDCLPDARLVSLGVAIELLRRATLTHREPAAEQAWPDQADLSLSRTLLGDALLAASFELLVKNATPSVVEILSSAMATVSEGELGRTIAPDPTRQRAAYAVGAADVAISLCGLTGETAARYRQYATAVGEAHERARGGQPAALPAALERPFAERGQLVSALEDCIGREDIELAPDTDRPKTSIRAADGRP